MRKVVGKLWDGVHGWVAAIDFEQEQHWVGGAKRGAVGAQEDVPAFSGAPFKDGEEDGAFAESCARRSGGEVGGVDAQWDAVDGSLNAAGAKDGDAPVGGGPDFIHLVGLFYPGGRKAIGFEHGEADAVGSAVFAEAIAWCVDDLGNVEPQGGALQVADVGVQSAHHDLFVVIGSVEVEWAYGEAPFGEAEDEG